MATLREWMYRILGTIRPRRADADLQEELRLHIELAAEDAQRRGESVRAARLHTGGATQAMDALRDQRGVSWLEELRRDVRYGLRTLRRSPSFTIVALVTLALGTGANAAIYQLLDAIRLRTLPVAAPDQLAIVQLADMTRWLGRRTSNYPVLTNPLWERFRDDQQIFSGVLAWSNAEFRLDRGISSRPARGLLVSGDFFAVLGVNPYVGRLLTREDDRPGCSVPSAVVSHGFWQGQLGGNPAVIGRTISVNARSVEVIGVTPPDFFGVEIGRAFDVAVPICAQASLGGEPDWLTNGTVWWLTVMGRLPAGESIHLVNQRLTAASAGLFDASLPADYPRDLVKDYLSFTLQAVPGSTGVSTLRTRYSDPLVILQLTTGLVLLIACTNLANLVLARASSREREFAVRLAVGGSWPRLVRQLMIENALLSFGGGILGLAFATASSRLLVSQLGNELSLELPLDARLIAVMLGTAFLTCLAFGLIPAWRAARVSAVSAMRPTMRTSFGSRDGTALRRILVIVQVACSLFLVFGGLLFATTLRNLLEVDAGFTSRNVSVVRVDFSSLAVRPPGRAALLSDLLDGVRNAPGVRSAVEVRHVPLGGTANSAIVAPMSDAAAKTTVRLNAMSPGYLDTIGMKLLAGRDFEARDSRVAPRVAIVNRAFARLLGLGDNPVGQTFRRPATSDVFEVIGLVPDSKYLALREDPLPIMFVPIAQIGDPRQFTDFMVRSALPAAELSSLLARTVGQVSPLIDVRVRPFDETVRDGLVRERLMALLSGGFGVLAALLAAVGLYGVMSYLVLRRTNEIGVRTALGATRGDILMMVLGEASRLIAIGLLVGSIAAFAAAGAARSLVFGVQPDDLGTIGLSCLLLGATALLASYLPARRAAWLHPLVALREN
jgi:predicted permease